MRDAPEGSIVYYHGSVIAEHGFYKVIRVSPTPDWMRVHSADVNRYLLFPYPDKQISHLDDVQYLSQVRRESFSVTDPENPFSPKVFDMDLPES
jgi:hypothetical protein